MVSASLAQTQLEIHQQLVYVITFIVSLIHNVLHRIVIIRHVNFVQAHQGCFATDSFVHKIVNVNHKLVSTVLAPHAPSLVNIHYVLMIFV